jgi:hypothetical protein
MSHSKEKEQQRNLLMEIIYDVNAERQSRSFESGGQKEHNGHHGGGSKTQNHGKIPPESAAARHLAVKQHNAWKANKAEINSYPEKTPIKISHDSLSLSSRATEKYCTATEFLRMQGPDKKRREGKKYPSVLIIFH